MLDQSYIELNYRTIDPPLQWGQIFDNHAPVKMEIGFGKCGFLLGMASEQNDSNFLGIEISRKYYRKGIKKVQRAELNNVKLLWGEAFHILKRYVPENSIDSLDINFPDPWPKKKHAKRRLLNADFAAIAAKKLKPAGSLEIATDMEPYIKEAMSVFDVNDSYEKIYYRTNTHPEHHRPYQTEYEQEFFHKGKTLYYARYQKKILRITL